MVISPDGTRMFVTDLGNGTVHALSLVPRNTTPFSSDPQLHRHQSRDRVRSPDKVGRRRLRR